MFFTHRCKSDTIRFMLLWNGHTILPTYHSATRGFQWWTVILGVYSVEVIYLLYLLSRKFRYFWQISCSSCICTELFNYHVALLKCIILYIMGQCTYITLLLFYFLCLSKWWLSLCTEMMMMMMMMMMSGFVERVINSPQTRCWSAKQVGLQMSSERRGESCGSQSGW